MLKTLNELEIFTLLAHSINNTQNAHTKYGMLSQLFITSAIVDGPLLKTFFAPSIHDTV